MYRIRSLFVLSVCLVSLCIAAGAASDEASQAQAYGEKYPIVAPQPDGTILAEAEEFQILPSASACWAAHDWGENYYASTFANTFLSRKAYLGAPPQCQAAEAVRGIEIPQAGTYLVLVRYEAAYRFETRFRVRIAQRGRVVFDREYGARRNRKIWAFRQKVRDELSWPWGATEAVVWEGHEASAFLFAGAATVTLIADEQPELAARRHVDVVMLTRDAEQVHQRIEAERYLPLDGMVTQQGDVLMRVRNASDVPSLTLTVPPGVEHSPYRRVKIRDWKPLSLTVEPGGESAWTEVGHLLDTMNDGQWGLEAQGEGPFHYWVEFGLGTPMGLTSIAAFESEAANLMLAYDGNTRYTRRIRRQEAVLYDLLDHLEQHPVPGRPPRRTLVYANTFRPRPEHPDYMAARDALIEMMGWQLTRLPEDETEGDIRGYVDVRRRLNNPEKQLSPYLQSLQKQGLAERIAVVSLGDEIHLAEPLEGDHDGFRAWLQDQERAVARVLQEQGGNWQNVRYAPDVQTARTDPILYYYSQRYRHHHGIETLKAHTDLIRQYLPNAGIGANYSPHHGYFYLGDTHKWVSVFRQSAMTMPWSEDYAWLVPVGTPQMSLINLDLFRAGLKHKPDAKIHYYVMPHWPGNTPRMWRRLFYGALAHGMKVVNLFEVEPVEAAPTENYVDLPQTYVEIRRALYELETFEDIVQEGHVQPGLAGLWFGETGDIWVDKRAPFGAAKRALYIGIRHQQLPLDMVVEADALTGGLDAYRILYLTDLHVSRAASQAIADWVERGGRLFATAGAGMWDEYNRPNPIMRQLFGIEAYQVSALEPQNITFIKQELPFLAPLDRVTWLDHGTPRYLPVFGVRSRMRVSTADVVGRFEDGTPAITLRSVGQGQVMSSGFLPSLSYFKPAIPLRPLDRVADDQAMAHWLPVTFDHSAHRLIGWLAADMPRPVTSHAPLVETTMIEAEQGMVIPVVNWGSGPVEPLAITVAGDLSERQVRLASGKPVKVTQEDDKAIYLFDLDVADALILR